MNLEILNSYFALRTRIDRFASSIHARYSDQMACGPGCANCCQAGLTVTIVEAVALGTAYQIDEDRISLQAGQPPLTDQGFCAFLSSDNLCRVFAARPLVCRTHGLPLKYPDQEGIRVCEKNFVYQMPHHSAVLDVTNMETALFAVNLDFCQHLGLNPMSRVALDRLANLISCRLP